MMQWMDFNQASDEQSAENIDASLRSLRSVLNDDSKRFATIRMYISSAVGTGHQSAGLHVLRRLVAPLDSPYKGFGYAKVVEVYYEGDKKREILQLLLEALPELNGQDPGRLYPGTAEIKLLDYNKTPPKEEVFFGFACGLDNNDEILRKILENLKVECFLRLQPFGWQSEAQILRKNEQPINLNNIPFLGGEPFNERAYFYPKPEMNKPQWNYYLVTNNDNNLRRKAEIVQWLTEENQLKQVALCPTYSIRNPTRYGKHDRVGCPMGDPAGDRIVQIVAGFRRMLMKQDKEYLPVLIINFDEYSQGWADNFERIKEVLNDGGQTPYEKLFNNEDENGEQRKKVDSGHKIRVHVFAESFAIPLFFLDNPNLAQVKTLVTDLVTAKKAVAFVQLGRVPPPLYGYFMSNAQLPSIFEGQNNANLALTLGKSYLCVARPEGYENVIVPIRYPTIVRALINASQTATMCQERASQIKEMLNLWKSITNNPTVLLSEFLFSERFKNGIPQYFTKLQEYYKDVQHDKFALALLYFAHVKQLFQQYQGTFQKRLALANDTPLAALFEELKTQIQTDGQVNLVPGIFSQGGLSDFYSKLLPAQGTLLIQNPALQSEPQNAAEDLRAVILSGTAPVMQPWDKVTFHFTAPNKTLISAAEFAGTHSWTPDGLPWIVFDQPFVRVNVADDALPITGSVGGTIAGTDLEISMDIPLTNGQTVFRGQFAELKTIADFMELAGGVDFTASIPEPLRTLTGLGVRYVEFAYNYKTFSLDYISFRLETDQSWPFLWFNLEQIVICIAIEAPGDLARRTISATIVGRFALGSGDAPPMIEVGTSLPGFTLWGQLGETPLTANDLIDLFHLGITPNWPQGHPPQVTSFTFFYGVDNGNFNVSSRLDLDWPITVAGQEILRIISITLSLSGNKRYPLGGLIGFILILPESANIGLSLTALYLGDQQGWRFKGEQFSGKIAVADLLSTYLQWNCPFMLDLDGLALTIETATNSFEFSGRVTGQWDSPIQSGIMFSGELRARIGYKGGSATLDPELMRVGSAEMPVLFADDRSVLLLPSANEAKQPGWFGEVSLDLTWNGIELTLFYNFDPAYQKFGITWGILTGMIEQKIIDGQKHQIATLQFTKSTTLGSMVEIMVSWLTGSKFALGTPWSILNSISLNGLALVYDFTANKVSFDIAIGPIEMGIARIEGISLSYNTGSANPDENGVIVTLKGSFRWQTDQQKPLSWDAARPEQTPGPPGDGNKYLDLRLLALGQHVTVTALQQAITVQQAIEAMQKLPIPDPQQIPPVKLDAASSWLIGADFGILKLEKGEKGDYFLTLQVVFNDPHLYGLRLALAGTAAKILAGLDFQILYRQVSETVGVYQAEITLPDAMRRLSIGAYTITMPVFGIALYTNGDFQIDLGFPWKADFSRSFTVEAIIYPGIPLLGSAGLYFGKLSSATTKLVPATTKGQFNPVLIFGFGMQVGFGKSVEYGAFKAGFSLTLLGILEGVIAKWNPYTPMATLPQVSETQIQGEYYFWLRGTLGIAGKLYGTVDFSIIKANVNVQLLVLIQITFAAYEPIVLTVLASVDVALKVHINLGLFKINISFSFSLQVKETFSILTNGTAPWSIKAAPLPGLLRAPLSNRLRALQETLGTITGTLLVPNWSNLLPADQPLELSGYLAPALTMAGDAAATLDQQKACAIALLFIASVPPATRDTQTSPQKAQGLLPDTSFELLCKQVLRWAIASIQDQPMSAAQIDQQIITDEQLLSLFNFLSFGDSPLPLEAIEAFLNAQFLFTVQLPPTEGESDATFFPMALPLELNIPDYGDWQGYTYTFADYNAISADFLEDLRTYFDELAVQVQQESGTGQNVLPASEGLSVANFVFGDYFLLLCRQLIQAARAALRDFTYPIPNNTTVGEIVTWVNEAGALNNAFTIYDLFAANPTHLLKKEKPLRIEANYTIQTATETFTSISTELEAAFTPTNLALANATQTGLLRPGAQISYPGQPVYSIQEGDDLLTVARHFAVNLADLLAQTNLLDQEELFRLSASLFLPYVNYQALITDTFDEIASLPAYGGAFSATLLARQNAGRTILRPGTAISYPDQETYSIRPGDCLGDLARHFGVSLTDLLDKTDMLTRSDVLAVAAVLAIPPFAASTGDGDTLQAIAARFNTTLAVLAASPGNLTLENLFDAATTPYLDLPHLPQFRVAELIAEIQRSLGLQHLSGMTSRYYLHGLRLPTAGITPKHRGMWVKEENGALTLPEHAGLYALIGQQFPLPVIEDTPLTIHLNRPSDLKWLAFAGENPGQLTITIAPDSLDNQRLQAVRAYATANRLKVALSELGQTAQVSLSPATYPFTSSLAWQCAATPTLPYGTQPTGVSALRLWALPAVLTNLPDKTSRAINPRFRVRVARYDEASGATINKDVACYGWASTIPFTVKRLPASNASSSSLKSSALKTSYEVVGAGGSDIILLERLLNQVRDDDSLFANVLLGYAPDQTGNASQGIQTDAPESVTMGIAQVNLSTETHPPSTLNALQAGPSLLNSDTELLRLLWEASITRTGGFYLYYYNAESAGGLPERIFNDKGEATVTLIVLYSKPPVSADQNRLTNYMNVLATIEPMDTAQAVVFAEANPIQEEISASSADTLASLAYRYYGDVGELARDNAEVPLHSGTLITISQGVYEVPPAGVEPGGDLARIADHFGTTVQAIKDANPQITNWPDPLPLFMAIRLPRIEVCVGDSSGGDTLGQLARFYGEALTALAVENQATPGLFATTGSIVIAGGPTVSSPTVPAGVLALETRRPVPSPVPDDPTDKDYGRLFLLHMYNLLSYRVSENASFLESALGLPAGPTTTPVQPGPGKIRVPREFAPGDLWDYRQALPYPKFAKQVSPGVDGLPDPAQSPYRALGQLLQLDFAWQDLYGNRLITTLSQPVASDQEPLNQPPLLTGYTDMLVGLSQWPSISSGWQVLPDQGDDLPHLDLLLSFDDSQYQGLLTVSVSDAITLLAHFTMQLDPQTAGDLANYQMSCGINIQKAHLLSDQETVELTVSSLEEETYTLSIKNIKSLTNNLTFSGQADFSYPDDPEKRSSTAQEQAGRDLLVYTQLYYQLTDPNDTALTIQTSLLKNETIPLSDPVVAELLTWISTLYLFLADRAQAGTSVSVPTKEHRISNQIQLEQLNENQIFELTLSLQITRTGGVVAGDLAAVPGIRQVETVVAPLGQQFGDPDAMTTFASQFEQAFFLEGAYQLKIATGIDRFRLSPTQTSSTLWVVRLGLSEKDTTGISYTIDNPGTPAIFAPRPISNTRENRMQVPIYDYISDQGIDFDVPSRFIDFTGIDLDLWVRQFFAAIDGVLAPEFTAAIQIVDGHKQGTYLPDLLTSKKALAHLASSWMIPVFADEQEDESTIQQVFEQQMLQQLSNAYTTHAGIQFQAQVRANTQQEEQEPARLLGNIVQNEISEGITRKVTLTSPKLTLQTGEARPLAFLLTAPDLVTDVQGQVVSHLPLNLTYHGSQIEHQIGSLAGIENYLASSWLSFVIPTTDKPLKVSLGEFPVPLVLRVYPDSPTMVEQLGNTPEAPAESLDQMTRWNYQFTYALPFHYPQDTIHGEVRFNVRSVQQADFLDAFKDLAEFMTVFPAVNKDLTGVLATIDASTTDQGVIDKAAIALASLNVMVDHVVQATQQSGGFSCSNPLTTVPTQAGSTNQRYTFTIQEGSIQQDGVEALLVMLHGQPPTGIAAPTVLIDPANYEVQPYECCQTGGNGTVVQEDFCFWYRHRVSGQPLSAFEGQSIPDRQIVLTGLDVLAYQDAQAFVSLRRNEELVPGKASAEPFIYTTGEVTFANPFRPTIDSGKQVIKIATIGSGTPPHPITRTFEEHLTAFFAALLQENTQPNLCIQVEIQYAYALYKNLSPLQLPILLQPPQLVQVAGQGSGTLEQMITDWQTALQRWGATNAPSVTDGVLWFDLTIMSELTSQPMPLLRLRYLCLPLQYIDPPLWDR